MEYRDIVLQVLAVLVLVGLAGLLVAAEVAITRVSRPRAEELVETGVRGAKGLQVVVEDRPRYVNVLLFLRLVCTTTAIGLATLIGMETVSGPMWWQIGLAVLVMVFVGYVVTGVAPRTLAQQHAEPVALAASGPARFLAGLLAPLTSLLILIGNAITPGKGYREGPFVSQAELRELLDQASADSVIEDEERQMLHSVFELGDTLVREVMVPRTEMVWIESTKTLRQALSLGLRSGFSRIPVIGENLDDVVGVVYLKDVARRSFENRNSERNERVDAVMRQAHFVPDSKRADDLLRDLQAARVHMAIVVDEYGGTAGIVTLEDLVEELVGDIRDEFDLREVTKSIPGGQVEVDGLLSLDDFVEEVGFDLPDGPYETVAGFMVAQLGRLPEKGDAMAVDGNTLTAVVMDGRRIARVLVALAPLHADDPTE